MKTTFKSYLLLSGLVLILAVPFACKKSDKDTPEEELGEIKGTPGNPRFNLQFTNSAKADLDIHVITPNGTEISYFNPAGQGGKLDLDCLCGDCVNGPNENIYWTPGTAPSGNYKVWVEYYGSCNNAVNASNYTLRVMNNSTVTNTYTGTLTNPDQKSQVYTFHY